MIHGPALLFCPGNRSDRYEKAAAAADSIIIDLEDSVAPPDKAIARERLADSSLDPARTIVRVSGAETADHEADLAAVARSPYRMIMLAKAESPAQFDALGEAGYRVLALCETALGVSRAAEIAAHPAVIALMWGAEDLVASMAGRSSRREDGSYRDVARYARARVLLEAKAAGKLAIGSVFLDIPDLEGLRDEVLDSVGSGFDANACIHPSQAAIIREAFAATAEERAWAERLLAEAAVQPGVFKFEGKMIDEPVLRQARAMLG